MLLASGLLGNKRHLCHTETSHLLQRSTTPAAFGKPQWSDGSPGAVQSARTDKRVVSPAALGKESYDFLMRGTLSVRCELREVARFFSRRPGLPSSSPENGSCSGFWVGALGFRPAHPKLAAALKRGSDPARTHWVRTRRGAQCSVLGSAPGVSVQLTTNWSR